MYTHIEQQYIYIYIYIHNVICRGMKHKYVVFTMYIIQTRMWARAKTALQDFAIGGQRHL